ncbi:MAG: hypothetical protein HZB38_18955 [Planctomycetes bacterium]|nr:hypothetical protein [Planctomycetota bacterium]
MKIKAIKFVPNDAWLAAKLTLEPAGTLTLAVARNSGNIWLVRKSRGAAHLAFHVKPEGRTYYQNELEWLAQELGRREFLGVGSTGQLLFDQGVEAQPTAHLEPRDLLDNSQDRISYGSDVPIPGVDKKDEPSA